jgi:hypothetical protein
VTSGSNSGPAFVGCGFPTLNISRGFSTSNVTGQVCSLIVARLILCLATIARLRAPIHFVHVRISHLHNDAHYASKTSDWTSDAGRSLARQGTRYMKNGGSKSSGRGVSSERVEKGR